MECLLVGANYDRLNSCGGVIMAEETADMGAWLAQLPEADLVLVAVDPTPLEPAP